MSFEEPAEGDEGLPFLFRFGVGVAGITVGVDGCTDILFCPEPMLILVVLALGVCKDLDDVDSAGLGMGVGTSSSIGEMRRVPPLLSASSKSFSVTLREPLRCILFWPPSAPFWPGGGRYWVSALSPPRNEDGGSRSPVDAERPAGPDAPWRDPNSDASLDPLRSPTSTIARIYRGVQSQ